MQYLSNKFVSLIIISPDHENVQYQWEKENCTEWETLSVPSNACVLYAKSCGKYRCTVGGEVYMFEVQGISA